MITKLVNLFQTNKKEITRFFKFSVVGTIGAVVDFGTLYLLHVVVHVPIVLANTCSFSAAVLSNFTWNRYWTYPDSRTKPIRAQLLQFFIVNVVGWGINTGLLVLLDDPFVSMISTLGRNQPALANPATVYKLGYNLAKAVATGVVLFWNFFVNRVWTYSDVK